MNGADQSAVILGGGPAGRALGGDAPALDQQHRRVGLAGVPGAIAFDEHDGPRVPKAEAGGKDNINILETTHKQRQMPVIVA